MGARTVPCLLIAAFAAALGHLSWHAWVGPPVTPTYQVGGELLAMASPDPEAKNLYLRRSLHLSQRPRHAWIQVLGRDLMLLHVNGQLVEQVELPAYPVAIVADLTRYLHEGKNTLAITARQAGLQTPPVVAVTGAYTLTDGDHPFGSDREWRCRTAFARSAAWWFEPAFDDSGWETVRLQTASLGAEVRTPPRAVQVPSRAQWVGAESPQATTLALRRDFTIQDRPQAAWLRVAATSSYRLAVNGILLDEQEDQLATDVPVPPVQRTYDITSVVHAGLNHVNVLLTATAGAPRLQADAEITTADGSHLTLATDETWSYHSGRSPDWLGAAGNHADWRPVRAETGDLTIAPWTMERQNVEVVLPFAERVWRGVGQGLLICMIGLATYGACRWTERTLRQRLGTELPSARPSAAYLALVPGTLALTLGFLATFDPRIPNAAVYRPLWAVLVVASVAAQWFFLFFLATWRWSPRNLPITTSWRVALRPLTIFMVLLVLAGAGFWLRYRDLETEPLHWDEVSVYTVTKGFQERGFPSNTIRGDMPTVYLNTNELAHAFTGLASLVFQDPRWVVRFPGVCWSILTLLLLFAVGTNLFRTPLVGLTAAAIFTFSPVVIAVSTFGRYFGPLQFFSLLSVWCFWHTIRGAGPMNHRALWLTAVSFIAVFLSWEGGALIAPGMILAALVVRRGKIVTLLRDPQLWLALLAVTLVIGLQLSHRNLQQTQSLWSGISASDADVRPIWRYAIFQPWYYVFESSWNQDALLPMLLLVGSALLALAHPWRQPLRLLLAIHLTTCLATSALLSIIAWRYIHHLVPLLILLAAATLVAGIHRLVAWGRRSTLQVERLHARLVGAAVLLALLAAGSGLLLQLPKLELFRVQGYGISQFKYVNMGGPSLFLKEHVRDGDVVLAHQPYTTNYFLDRQRADYWLQTTLYMTETLADHQPTALDRRDGTPLLSRLDALQELFASDRRIWYVVAPSGHSSANRSEISSFLREHMDVVYEDYKTLVLLRDRNYRPASLRATNQKALRTASIEFLP